MSAYHAVCPAQTSVAVSTREPARDAAINVVGGLHVLGAAREHGVERFVFSSSCSVYGAGGENSAEDSALRPLSLYARLKVEAETRQDDVIDHDRDMVTRPDVLTRQDNIAQLPGSRPHFTDQPVSPNEILADQ